MMNRPTFIDTYNGKKLVAGRVGSGAFFSHKAEEDKGTYLTLHMDDLKAISDLAQSASENSLHCQTRDTSYMLKEESTTKATRTKDEITIQVDSTIFWPGLQMPDALAEPSERQSTAQLTLPLNLFQDIAKTIEKGPVIWSRPNKTA